jgi:Protein of unknown function (DUF3828)
MPALTLAPLLLAAATLSPADTAAIDAAVAAIFAPYRKTDMSQSAFERPIWSAETAALIARWRRVTPQDEVDDLSDADWLCMCQDWDAARFRAVVTGRRALAAGVAEVTVRMSNGGTPEMERMRFRREGGRWRLDDMVARDFPRGIKQALRDTIAADLKLRR